MKTSLVLLVGVCGLACLPGCFVSGADDDSSSTFDPYADLPDTEADTAEYKKLEQALEEHRTEFLGERADEQRAVGRRLYWLEFAGFDPTLHSFDPEAGPVDYTFSIGGGDAYNFEASESVIATAYSDGDTVVFDAYDAAQPTHLLDEIEVPAPTDEQRWWAYAVDGSDVYYVTTGDSTVLHKWHPGSAPAEVLTLEETGAEVGIFLAFGIEHGRMMFNESGRAWVLDLAAKQSVFLGHDTEVDGAVSFDEKGAFVPTATAPLYYDFATGTLTDVAMMVDKSGYRLNETYDTVQRYEADGILHDGRIYYVGGSGVFVLDLASGDVTPILLEPIDEDVRVEYRYPVVTDDGELYVTGLTSTSGSVGADGPIYAVSPAP